MCNKMSDVRLSNASPTLERVEARPPDQTRPPVCRNLFGTLDGKEHQRDSRAKMEESARLFAERWNFDVEHDVPLPAGNCDWEAVSGAPEFYSRAPHVRGENVDLNGNDPARKGSRKRTANSSGGCASECERKRSHTDEDDDDDDRAGSSVTATATSAEKTLSDSDSVPLQRGEQGSPGAQ